MTVVCRGFRCVPLTNGDLQLVIESPIVAGAQITNPHSSAVLHIEDIALKLKVTPKTVRRMAERKRNPLPLDRSNGRPFMVESNLYYFLNGRLR